MGTQASPAGPDPLAAFRLFETNDLDCARDFVARAFCPHLLDLVDSGQMLRTRQNHARGRAVSLSYLSYGAAVKIEPGELTRFYLVQIPVRGAARVQNGRTEVFAGPGAASLLNPTLNTRMEWSGDCEKILVQIDRAALNARAETLADATLASSVVFDPAVPMLAGPMRRWVGLARWAAEMADTGKFYREMDARGQQALEEGLIDRLLESQPSTISALLARKPAAGCPRAIKRAREFIHAHAAEPLSVTSIGEAAGCSVRSLQLGFRARFGLTPLEYLRERRLALADLALQTAPRGATVAEIAESVGFAHLGRFAAFYRARFGQSPHLTSRRT